MNFRVVIQPDAEAEVEEAFNYIAAHSLEPPIGSASASFSVLAHPSDKGL